MKLMDRHVAAQDQQLYGAAMICALLSNIHKDSKKRSKPFEPADFLPKRSGRVDELEIPDGEELYKQTLAIFGTLGGNE